MHKWSLGTLLAAAAQRLGTAAADGSLCWSLMSLSRILPLLVCELNLALSYLYDCTSLRIDPAFAAGLSVGTGGKKLAA